MPVKISRGFYPLKSMRHFSITADSVLSSFRSLKPVKGIFIFARKSKNAPAYGLG
jgi:hypothetical protein